MTKVMELREYTESTFPNWLANDIAGPMDRSDLEAWVNGNDEDKLSIGRLSESLAYRETKKFVSESVRGRQDMQLLAHATRLSIPRLPYAIGVQHLNTNSGVGLEPFMEGLAQVMAIGWRDWAELLARLGLQELGKHSMQRGRYKGGALGQGTTSHGFTYMLLDVVKDWLRAEKTSTETVWREDAYERYAGGYGGWAELVENWREPNVFRFEEMFYRAADYHVAQSHDMEFIGHKHDPDFREVHYEVEQDKYWLFPVILFTFLRLREWEGLKNPASLQHDLFRYGVFKHLPPVPDWPQDPFLDAVDHRFRVMFPETPSLNDLPRLRQEQS